MGDAVVGDAVLLVALLVLYGGLHRSYQQHKQQRDGGAKGREGRYSAPPCQGCLHCNVELRTMQ